MSLHPTERLCRLWNRGLKPQAHRRQQEVGSCLQKHVRNSSAAGIGAEARARPRRGPSTPLRPCDVIIRCAWTHLVRQIEVRVHFDHLPAAVAVLINAYQEAGVVLLPPVNVKVCCLGVTWNHVPAEAHARVTPRHRRLLRDKARGADGLLPLLGVRGDGLVQRSQLLLVRDHKFSVDLDTGDPERRPFHLPPFSPWRSEDTDQPTDGTQQRQRTLRSHTRPPRIGKRVTSARATAGRAPASSEGGVSHLRSSLVRRGSPAAFSRSRCGPSRPAASSRVPICPPALRRGRWRPA